MCGDLLFPFICKKEIIGKLRVLCVQVALLAEGGKWGPVGDWRGDSYITDGVFLAQDRSVSWETASSVVLFRSQTDSRMCVQSGGQDMEGQVQ